MHSRIITKIGSNYAFFQHICIGSFDYPQSDSTTVLAGALHV